MNTLLLYMIKSAIFLAGFYLVYFIFLSRDTSYTRNRIFLLASLFLSLIIPLISFDFPVKQGVMYFGKTLSEVFVTAERTSVNSDSGGSIIPPFGIIVTIYYTGVIILGFKLLIDTVSLFSLISRFGGNKEKLVRVTGLNTSGFSAMGYIFINQLLGRDETSEIIKHEQNHLRHNHYIDILLMEIIKVFQWFNPAVYFINRSLRAVHEYQADEGCISQGIRVVDYQKLLLSQIFKTKIFAPSNSFSNPSLLRKRMLMMTRSRSGSAAGLKILFVIPMTIFLVISLSSFDIKVRNLNPNSIESSPERTVFEISRATEIKAAESDPPPPPPPPPSGNNRKEPEVTVGIIGQEVVGENLVEPPDEVFVVVEEMPKFPGGDKALMDFIYANIVYPEKAKENGIQGRVVLRFAVMYNGDIDNITVIKGVDPAIDEEAKRVIGLLPKWQPGKQGGKPVNVWYSVPVTFQLK